MEISLDQKNISCRKEVFRQTKMIQEHADFIVPDRYEDIAKLAFTEIQLLLKGKDLTSHGASVNGSAEINLFYIAEGLERLRCVSLVKDFTVDFDSEAVTADSVLQASIVSQGVQTRLVNSRKIALQLAINVELTAWTEDVFPLSVQIDTNEENGMQLLWDKKSCMLTTEVTEKTFVISEQIPLPSDESVTQIVCSHAELVCYEHQMIGSKLLLKGGAELRFGYETESSLLPQFSAQCIPFSVLIDSPGEDVDIGSVILQPTALYATLADAVNGSKVVEAEIHAVAQISFCAEKEMTYLSDAFSTRFPLQREEKALSVCSSRRRETHSAAAEEQSDSDETAYSIVAQRGELLSYAIRDGKAVASAVISGVLRAEDGSLSVSQKLLSFEMQMPDDCCELSQARLLSYEVRTEQNRISFSAEIQFDFDTFDYAELCAISSILLDTDNAYSLAGLPALTLTRQKNESVWELAKRYHTSVAAIEEMSGKYELPPHILLIPRS